MTDTATALQEANVRLPALEARILVSHLTGCRQESILSHPEIPCPSSIAPTLCVLVARRAAGEPLAYLLGQKEFYGRSFRVTSDVLVPRPETEHLIEEVLARAPKGKLLVDIGTGSGILAVTLALEGKYDTVLATDVSLAALSVARENARALGVRIGLRRGDLWEALPTGTKADVAVANLPYVAKGVLPTLALEHEPRLALDGGPDGLDLLERIVRHAPHHLAPGGLLALEIGYDQGPWATAVPEKTPALTLVALVKDLAGHDRVALFRRRADDEVRR